MSDDDARALFSDYIEQTLDLETRDKLQAYLGLRPELAAELLTFERTLSLVHRLPSREPVLDLWREFAPRMAEYQAERKVTYGQRLRTNWMRLLSQISAGVILWTHALASRAHARLERHLLHDPLGHHHSTH